MKIISKVIIFFLVTLISVPFANAQTGIIDKVVAVIGGEAIFLSDIEEELRMARLEGMRIDDNAACQILEKKLVNKLLLAQAKIDSLTVNDNAVREKVERRISGFIAQSGNAKAVENYFNMPMHKIKEALFEVEKENALSDQMQGKLMQGISLTPEDVTRYFDSTPKDSLIVLPDQYIIQQILRYPPSTDANFLAREQLLSIRERVLNGEKFSTLAILYSEDPGSQKRGGELGLKPKSTYLPAFADAAMALKPGQVSPVVETEYGFHIIQMIDKQSNDMINVRHILITPKYSIADEQQASAKLDSIRTKILADSIKFEDAALQYSQDPKSRLNGGIMVNETQGEAVIRFDKDQLQPGDYFVLKNLKEGEISEPFQSHDNKGKVVFKILKLKELIPSHTANIVDDYAIIKSIAENNKRMDKFFKWIKQKAGSTYIQIDPEYKNCKFQYSTWGTK